jgi:hypothetical protein
MHTLTINCPVADSHRTSKRGVRWVFAWPRIPRLAVGIVEFGFLAVLFTVWWLLPHSPHSFAPVMPLGLPDLLASFDAIVLTAQVLADAPQPAPLPAPNQLPAIPALPSMETVLVNLGGWSVVLWHLANKIINRFDERIVRIERQLEKLETIPSRVDERAAKIERQLKKWARSASVPGALHRRLDVDRKSRNPKVPPGKDPPEEHPA